MGVGTEVPAVRPLIPWIATYDVNRAVPVRGATHVSGEGRRSRSLRYDERGEETGCASAAASTFLCVGTGGLCGTLERLAVKAVGTMTDAGVSGEPEDRIRGPLGDLVPAE